MRVAEGILVMEVLAHSYDISLLLSIPVFSACCRVFVPLSESGQPLPEQWPNVSGQGRNLTPSCDHHSVPSHRRFLIFAGSMLEYRVSFGSVFFFFFTWLMERYGLLPRIELPGLLHTALGCFCLVAPLQAANLHKYP